MSDPVPVREVGPEAAARWDGFVAGQPSASAYHAWQWREILTAEFGCEPHYLLAGLPDAVRGVLPLIRLRSRLFGDFLVSLPFVNYGGCLAVDEPADSALMAAAASLAAQLGVSHVEFRERRSREGFPQRTDKVAMLLELATTPDEQFSAFGSKLRAQIRRPEKEGATTRIGGVELVPDFYEVFARNMRDLGTPVYARSLFSRIANAMPDGARIAVVYLEDRPVAAGFTLRHRDRMEIPWASSLREFNRVGVNMQLYWHILKHAIESGTRVFDFGRSTVDAGTYKFKAQWGAKPVQLFWHYWLKEGRPMPNLSPHSPKYALAIRAWQRLPVPVANLIGPRLVRFLP
ncbi:MAG: FemAB family PEP-CTERM system-associated protein [Gammaproteobacteria bacterium PRO9]|nr:FemAB family PEP-CTERM system-associated protein [Gammaproteobacteria bacterium PRO9]